MHADGAVTVTAERELAAMMEVANVRRLMVATHCTSSPGVKMCVRQGVQAISHAPHADEEARHMLEAAKDRIFVAPAAGLPISMLRHHQDFDPKWSAAKIAAMESEVETVTRCLAVIGAQSAPPGGMSG